MIYMLDTNICGYIIREKPFHIKDRIKALEKEHTLALSIIVVAELLYGAKKKDNPLLIAVIEHFIDNFVIYNFDINASIEYAIIRSELEASGKIIGSNDLFIAAHAKSLKAVLVTNNVQEFKRVKGLQLDNWI